MEIEQDDTQQHQRKLVTTVGRHPVVVGGQAIQIPTHTVDRKLKSHQHVAYWLTQP
jgi:hypothetical protein